MRRPGELQNGAAAAPIKDGLAAGVPEQNVLLNETLQLSNLGSMAQAKSKQNGDIAKQNPLGLTSILAMYHNLGRFSYSVDAS